ncbi:MAG: YlcI/YnfO family protein [Massilia sp.]
MKTASFPSLRVDEELRQAAEDSLREGETISSFVEQSIRENIDRRQRQREFLTRGLASRAAAMEMGHYIAADAVLDKLEHMLAKAKAAR